MRRCLLFCVLLAAACQSGCFYGVSNIYRLGVTHEQIEAADHVLVGTDGSVAIQCQARYFREGPGLWSPPQNTVSRQQRFLVLTQAYPSTERQQIARDPAKLLVDVGDPAKPALLIPTGFAAGDASTSNLPAAFAPPVVSTALSPIESFVRPRGEFPRSQRAGWSYPLQILLIPAVAIDLVTLPLQGIYDLVQISNTAR